MDSLRGKLLIAHPTLQDPNFARTVILIVKHGEDGALGVVLNQPMVTSVKEAIGDAVDEPFEVEGLLHKGGPCDGLLMVLHTAEHVGEMDVLDGLFFSVERDKVEWLLKHEAETEGVKFFVGYAGWGANQLESELLANSWIVAPANLEIIFDADIEQLWSRLLAAITLGRYIRPEQLPDDPSLN